MAEGDEVKTIFAQYRPGSWKPDGGEEVVFAVISIVQSGGNRLVAHKRLRKAGARHDSMGADVVAYELTIHVFNGCEEPGVPIDSYPDVANQLIEAMATQATGDLNVPTVGKRRCRADTYRRTEDLRDGGRDAAIIVAKFYEDSEDDADQAAFSAPSASSAASKQAEEVEESMDESGPSLGDTLSDLRDAADQIQDLANAPGEFADHMEKQADSVMQAADDVTETVSSAGSRYSEELANLFTDPGSTVPGRAMNRFEDTARRATQLVAPAPFSRIVDKKYPTAVSIFDVATDVQQDSVKLMAINGSIEDLRSIPAGTPVKVFA